MKNGFLIVCAILICGCSRTVYVEEFDLDNDCELVHSSNVSNETYVCPTDELQSPPPVHDNVKSMLYSEDSL